MALYRFDFGFQFSASSLHLFWICIVSQSVFPKLYVARGYTKLSNVSTGQVSWPEVSLSRGWRMIKIATATVTVRAGSVAYLLAVFQPWPRRCDETLAIRWFRRRRGRAAQKCHGWTARTYNVGLIIAGRARLDSVTWSWTPPPFHCGLAFISSCSALAASRRRSARTERLTPWNVRQHAAK